MEGFGGEGAGFSKAPSTGGGPRELGGGCSDNTSFDASQYPFFGKDALEEVELGGLEDDEDEDVGLVATDEDFNQLSPLGDTEEGEGLGSLSDIDDLASTFSKLNRNINEPRSVGVIGDRGSFSRESSSTADWSQEADFSNWLDQQVLDAENVQAGQRWWSQPHSSSVRIGENKPLYRASSYPEQPQQQHCPGEHIVGPSSSPVQIAEPKSLYRASSYPQQQQQQQQHGLSEPLAVPNSPFTSYPPPIHWFQALPDHTWHSNAPSLPSVSQLPLSAPNLSPLSGSQLHLTGQTRGHPHGGNMVGHVTSARLSLSNQAQNWSKLSSTSSGDHPDSFTNLIQQQSIHPNGFMPSQLLLQQQQQRMHLVQPLLSHFSHLQSQFLSPRLSPQILSPQMMNKNDALLGMADPRDQRSKPAQRGKQGIRISKQGSDASQKSDNGWPQFRSKYMSADEIESILRMQHAATHSNDPYIDDYYHQACLAKKRAGPCLKEHFCPTFIRDLPSWPHANNEPHAYLQVDALGRVQFSSIRRPRPLLEVDPPASGENILDQKSSVKPLELEPLLVTRISIEDGFCLLLDVDDIDRVLQFSQQQDGGSQLRRRRQVLLEGLAASLQLVDPLGPGKPGHSVGLGPNDDLVFLRLVSLPKGRKLLSRYIHLLFPGSELARVVCMAIFRHLRFLFGGLPSDSSSVETTDHLARTVSSCVSSMDLSALSACLAAIACSSEQPPLRPLGSSAGDGASIIIKSVLEKATGLLTSPHAANNYNLSNRSLWQASFNAFFTLLTKYCISKYDSIMQSLLMQSPNAVIPRSEAAKAISREMPVELLRASLPHTDEHQRKMLVDFAQRSTMPVTGLDAHGSGSGQMNLESVLG